MKKPTKAKLRARAEASLAFAAEVRQEYLNDELIPDHTPSGLGICIHTEGSGPTAKPGQKVEVHYVGMLEKKGKVFDESFSQPRGVRFILGKGEVVPAWDEAIALLRAGDEATLFVPSKLGYGPKGRGQGIPSNSDLIFYVEVVAIG